MSKPQTGNPQMWLIAAVVGVVAVIGIRYWSGSTEPETAAPQRMAQRETKTETGGWSVRSKSGDSGDLPSADDVKVPRRLDAKPGNVPPQRDKQRAEPQGGQPSGDTRAGAIPAQPGGGTGEPAANVGGGAAPRNTGATVMGHPVASARGSTAGGSVDYQDGTEPRPANIEGEPNVPGTGNTQDAGTQEKPPQDEQAQPTPLEAPTPGVIAVGALYDSRDTTFSIDTPVEVKDIGTIPGGVTMMMQLDPDWTPESMDDADLLRLGDSLALTKNVHFLRFVYTDPSGTEHPVGTDMRTWEGIEPPYSMAATVNGDQLDLVVNGKVVGHRVMEGATYDAPANPSLQIGCDYAPGRPCAGGAANGVVVVPPISVAELIARTRPAQTGKH